MGYKALTPWTSGQNGGHFAVDIFRIIFLYENCCILIKKNSPMFVPGNPADNKTALVQIMDWGQTGDKLLSEPSSLTHKCVTKSQRVHVFWLRGQPYDYLRVLAFPFTKCPCWCHDNIWLVHASLTTMWNEMTHLIHAHEILLWEINCLGHETFLLGCLIWQPDVLP